MTEKKTNGQEEIERRVKQLEETIEKLSQAKSEQEAEPEQPATEGSTAGEVLQSVGGLIPGLGGLIKAVSKMPAFQERLAQVDEELQRKLGDEALSHVQTKVTFGGNVRSLARCGAGQRAKPFAHPKPKPKHPEPETRMGTEMPQLIVDLFDEPTEITALAVVPGVEEKDIQVNVEGQTLSVAVDTPEGPYRQQVELPAPVEGQPRWSLANGVLKIQMNKKIETNESSEK